MLRLQIRKIGAAQSDGKAAGENEPAADAERVDGTDVVALTPSRPGDAFASGLIRHEDEVGTPPPRLPAPAMKTLREVSRCPSRL